MKITTIASVTAALAVTILPFTASISAQDAAPEGGRGERRERGERGERRGNPEEFRQRMTERLKTSMKVTDEEWSVIQPLIEKVQEKRRSTTFGRFGGFGGRGGRGGRDGGPGGSASSEQSRPGMAESQALRTALENENASADELKAKLTAVRESRKKAQAELDQASDELRKVLTVRQEAALVSMGLLE